MSYLSNIKVIFKEDIPKELDRVDKLSNQLHKFIKEKLGDKKYHFEVDEFYDDLDASINFEMFSGKWNHMEWQLGMVISFFKENYSEKILDFNIDTTQTVEDLCFNIEDLDYEN